MYKIGRVAATLFSKFVLNNHVRPTRSQYATDCPTFASFTRKHETFLINNRLLLMLNPLRQEKQNSV